ncbi:glycosyltransferase [Rhodoferax sp. BLA1]|uniref:glycosyltransferase n=1 Tax=Rhodoferax sp. BLA1 TaxID=2576062 RepID=UPI0015D30C39|nr:glycosyltransferase [Rhodoferax sp. BLA1]
METVVRRRLGRQAAISISPYMPRALGSSLGLAAADCSWKFDFVYVASGDKHKNHGNLLIAWRLLAEQGVKPSLALTVDAINHPLVAEEIAKQTKIYSLNIINLGKVVSDDIPILYGASSALIFPSKVESFGLPLIEASQIGLPVLAPELDYVRDVVEPIETFDPESPTSIARAVRRFLRNPDKPTPVGTVKDFLTEVFR